MAPGRTVLIAENDENDAFFLKRAFEKSGLKLRVVCVPSGQETVQYLGGSPPYDDRSQYPLPDLLVLGIDMPDLDGLAVLLWIQTQKELRELPVIVLSDSLPEFIVEQIRQTGVCETYQRQIDNKSLAGLVREWNARWLQPREVAA